MSLQALNDFRNNPNSPIRLALSASLMTGAGAFTAGTFTTLSPLGGAVFGISTFLSYRFIDWTANQLCCCCSNLIFTISTFALSILGGVAAGAYATSAVGFPLTFTAGAALSGAMLATAIATFFVVGTCLCISWIATVMISNPRTQII